MEEFEFEEENKRNPIRLLFFLLLLTIILTIIYARYFGTTGLYQKNIQIKDENISDSFNGFKIVHFSDFHYGNTTSLKELKNLRKKINLTKPDIIVFTGDFIDKNYSIDEQDINDIKIQLNNMNAKYGKYYISGDNDIKNEFFNTMFDESNFINLDDKNDILYNEKNDSILLCGLSYKSSGNQLEELFKNNLPTYKIILMHMPDNFDEIKQYNFNLVLAGHSYGGNIKLPIIGTIYTPKGARKYYNDYYKIDNTNFYISSGIGTNQFKFRLYNRPSFNLYTLKK